MFLYIQNPPVMKSSKSIKLKINGGKFGISYVLKITKHLYVSTTQLSTESIES